MSTVRNILEQFFKQFEASYETLNLIEVSRSAILTNLDLLQSTFEVEHVIPVLKANAYGHGLEQTVRILEDRKVPYIAVDGYHEALQVRAMSDLNVLVMGAIMPENFNKIDIRHVAYVVQDKSVLNVLTNLRRPIKIHLEFNTGMNRQGFDSGEVKDVVATLKDNPHIELDGVMSHLYDAAGTKRDNVNKQVKLFDEIVAKIKKSGLKPSFIHVAKTGGLSDIKSKHINTIRPGTGLYGINPYSKGHPLSNKFVDLRPALSFYSRLIKIHELSKGDSVSYGQGYTLGSAQRIGVVPAGYYEGVHEILGNNGSFRYKRSDAPIRGAINMNHTMIDITDCKAKLWDRVEIISNDSAAPNSIRSLLENKGIYPLVALSRLSPDVRRTIVD